MAKGVKIDVQIDPPAQIVRRIGLDKQGDVQRFWTATVLRRIQRYMPYRTGNTIKLTIAQTDISVPEIITDTPWAARLYRGAGMTFTRTKNPMAGPAWDKSLVTHEGPAMRGELQAYLDGR